MKLQMSRFVVLLMVAAIAVVSVSVAGAKTTYSKPIPGKVNKVNVVKPRPRMSVPKPKIPAQRTVKPPAPKKTSR